MILDRFWIDYFFFKKCQKIAHWKNFPGTKSRSITKLLMIWGWEIEGKHICWYYFQGFQILSVRFFKIYRSIFVWHHFQNYANLQKCCMYGITSGAYRSTSHLRKKKTLRNEKSNRPRSLTLFNLRYSASKESRGGVRSTLQDVP